MTVATRPPPLPSQRLENNARRVRDPHADLLRDARGMPRDLAAAREAWFAGLALERKDDVLFELEMLLKGLVAWGNPRNHPGGRSSDPVVARDYTAHLAVAEAVLRRCRALCTDLLGVHRRAVGYSRYFTPAPPADPRGSPPATHSPESAEDALVSLGHGLVAASEVADGLLRTGTVLQYRLFYAAVVLVQREVARNAYFNPLVSLEFRPEFDRVKAPEVLEAIQGIEGDVAYRLVALAYLGSYRLLRLTGLIVETASDASAAKRSYALLAGLRADARALVHTMRVTVPAAFADGLERELMKVPASELRGRYESLVQESDRLLRVRACLYAHGSALRSELRHSLETGFPDCASAPLGSELGAMVREATLRLRAVLSSGVAQLTRVLRGDTDVFRLTGDVESPQAVSDRTRQSVWMFALMTRAFVAKARGAGAFVSDGWEVPSSQAFVQAYLGYFRALGRQLAVDVDYPAAETLLRTLDDLRDVDYLEPSRLESTAAVCEAFGSFLQDTLAQFDLRDDLQGLPFDKLAAAETLKTYLRG